MLMKEDDCESIPAFEDVFRDDEDEDEQEASSAFVAVALKSNGLIPVVFVSMPLQETTSELCCLSGVKRKDYLNCSMLCKNCSRTYAYHCAQLCAMIRIRT